MKHQAFNLGPIAARAITQVLAAQLKISASQCCEGHLLTVMVQIVFRSR
jgi:hypothetical protein